VESVTPRTYSIEIESSAWRDLMKIPENQREKIFDAIYTLEQNPRPSGCKKLKGRTGFYRIRLGDFRVITMSRRRC
jgi:mRNA interferase RelE/StbE